ACLPRPGWGLAAALVFVGFPALAFAVFSRGSALLGVKYLLPLYPFLCVLIGRTATLAPRAALVLAALAALEALWIHPHELMYYTRAAGGPERGRAISVVGDDWGQGVRATGRWAAEHAQAIAAAGGLWYEPYTAGDKAAFGLEDARPLHG